jgi:hypothetical protein
MSPVANRPETLEVLTRKCGGVTVGPLSVTGWEVLKTKLAAALDSGIVSDLTALLTGNIRAVLSGQVTGAEEAPGARGAVAELLERGQAVLPSIATKLSQALTSHFDRDIVGECIETDVDLTKLSAREFLQLREAAIAINDPGELAAMEKNFWLGLVKSVLAVAQTGPNPSSESESQLH